MTNKTALSKNNNTPMIDAHVHFVDPTRPEGVVWPLPTAPFHGRKRVNEYVQEMKGADIRGVIAVETSRRDCDDDYLRKISSDNDYIVGYVANLAPDTLYFKERLEMHCLEQKFKGIRLRPISRYDLRSEEVAEISRMVGVRGAVVELGVQSYERVQDFYALARCVPEARFVLVHAGHPITDSAELDAGWMQTLLGVAAPKNVWCKITSNFGRYSQGKTEDKSLKALRLSIDTITNAFTTEKILWGSNWPVAEAQEIYKLLTITKDYIGEKKTNMIVFENAWQLYNLEF